MHALKLSGLVQQRTPALEMADVTDRKKHNLLGQPRRGLKGYLGLDPKYLLKAKIQTTVLIILIVKIPRGISSGSSATVASGTVSGGGSS